MRPFPSLRPHVAALLAIPLSLALLAGCSLTPPERAPWLLATTPLDRDAAGLDAEVEAHLAAAEVLRLAILAVDGERTPENTLVPFNTLEMHIDAASNDCQLLEAVHPDSAVRDTAQVGAQRVSEYGTALGLDRALYEAMAAVQLAGAHADTHFVHEKIMREFRRSGVDRDEAVRERLRALDAELVKLGQDFSKAIRDGVRKLQVAPEALAGLPGDFVASHEPGEDGLVTLDTTYPDYQPVMKYATNMDLRRRLFMEYKNRAYPENIAVLSSMLTKRKEKAALLGYSDWPEYVMEPLMIGDPAHAAAFIDRVTELARPVAGRDMAQLLEDKRKLDPAATSVEEFEGGLYADRVRKDTYDFDSQVLRPYLEFGRVQQGILDLSARLFGLRFVQVDGLDLWHASVTAWDVFDGHEPVGRFYLDLFPRENKYGHAACFPYRMGVGGQRLPQAVLVCNFPDPSKAPDGVALMEFGQVSTFFHEFGHLLHMLLSGRQQWIRNSGFGVEWDFVEAPSQMLEEFLLEPEVLQSFAVHHETGEPVPVELIEKLRRSSEFGKGTSTAQQMFYAAVSLRLHLADPANLDSTAMVQQLQRRYSPYAPIAGTHLQCSFGHLEGYSAIYYTYMWSQVIAKDLYSRFERDGVLSPGVARDYREQVLEAGGSRPAGELVADFLGRATDFEAFESWLARE